MRTVNEEGLAVFIDQVYSKFRLQVSPEAGVEFYVKLHEVLCTYHTTVDEKWPCRERLIKNTSISSLSSLGHLSFEHFMTSFYRLFNNYSTSARWI